MNLPKWLDWMMEGWKRRFILGVSTYVVVVGIVYGYAEQVSKHPEFMFATIAMGITTASLGRPVKPDGPGGKK